MMLPNKEGRKPRHLLNEGRLNLRASQHDQENDQDDDRCSYSTRVITGIGGWHSHLSLLERDPDEDSTARSAGLSRVEPKWERGVLGDGLTVLVEEGLKAILADGLDGALVHVEANAMLDVNLLREALRVDREGDEDDSAGVGLARFIGGFERDGVENLWAIEDLEVNFDVELDGHGLAAFHGWPEFVLLHRFYSFLVEAHADAAEDVDILRQTLCVDDERDEHDAALLGCAGLIAELRADLVHHHGNRHAAADATQWSGGRLTRWSRGWSGAGGRGSCGILREERHCENCGHTQ
jgi:hypothetical protein